ncbi:AAA family ATPase [Clostridium sp. HBUAS56017]|uniref:ATP-dependent nuclease n=1 Tax=Clostridium sp. HBUAS56017 TaxID=2571128 RepID=UPI00163DA0BD|nr:AAA family ATPase [Clostridium sp. HBUAS56017]
MYIYKIDIKNFRNIKNLSWKPNKGINVLVGGNGVGKSNIAIALDYLLNPYIQWYKRDVSEFDFYDRDLENKIEVEVWFKAVENFIEDDWETYLEHVDSEDNITTEEDAELILRVKFYVNKDRVAHHVILTNNKEYPFKTTQKGFINYIYISTNREPLKDLSLNTNSLLSSILNKEMLDDKMKELLDSFNVKSKELFSMEEESLFPILSKGAKEFGIVDEETAMSLEAIGLSDKKAVQSFSLMCKNKNITQSIPLNYQSDGIKNLMLLLALYEKINDSGILFLEEIEQNLEPATQRKVVKKFISNNNKQTFITTHSTEILKMFKLDQILYMNENIIKVLPKIDSGIDKYFRSAAEYQVLSSLFSKAVLLVEGDAELGGVPIISKAYDDFLEDRYITLIRCQGKDNIIRFAKFFNELGIKNIAIYDNDSDIDNSLQKYTEVKLNTLALIVPKDYEGCIVDLKLFFDNWKGILNNRIEFEVNKYINNLFIESRASQELKEIYSLKKSEVNNIRNIGQIEEVLNEEELKQYLQDFLHKHMASISNAEYLMENLYIISKESGQSAVPIEYENIFKIIDCYIKYDTYEKECLLSEENGCRLCADIREGYEQCYEIKGNINGTE